MRITCPGCSTRYGLPPHLVGPAGARVSCPSCGLAFVVSVSGELAAVLGAPAENLPEPQGDTNGAVAVDESSAHPQPEPVPALDALRALDDPPGTFAAAAAEGRLFADHGPVLLELFEALERDRPGDDVAADFRQALSEVAGVELAPPGS